LLQIKRRRFFQLLKAFRENPEAFSLIYKRKTVNRRIKPHIEEHIFFELQREKSLIDDPQVPIRDFNYSYIKDELLCLYQDKVSLPTIINRAKKGSLTTEKS
jgi:hypothetical protein